MLERLHKVLARAGVAALRPAEDMIMAGRVTVNGRVVRELGARVDADTDVIAVDGQLIELRQPSDPHRYLALHKPIGVVSTAYDPQGRPTVVGMAPSDVRLFPVGRLDSDSEGLILLTDDGDLAYRLTHPRFEVEKEYRVLLDHTPKTEDLRRWREGVELEGQMTMPAWIEVLDRAAEGTWVRVVMREGRNRQIREVARLLGYQVLRLIRVREGPLALGDLAPGAWRELTPVEVQSLRAHTQHIPSRAADQERERRMANSDRPEGRRLRIIRGQRRSPGDPAQNQAALDSLVEQARQMDQPDAAPVPARATARRARVYQQPDDAASAHVSPAADAERSSRPRAAAPRSEGRPASSRAPSDDRRSNDRPGGYRQQNGGGYRTQQRRPSNSFDEQERRQAGPSDSRSDASGRRNRDVGSSSRPRTGDNRGPQRSYGDRGPQRSFDDRGPQRSFDDRGPQRSFDDRGPRRGPSQRGPQGRAEQGGSRDYGQGSGSTYGSRRPADRTGPRNYDRRPGPPPARQPSDDRYGRAYDNEREPGNQRDAGDRNERSGYGQRPPQRSPRDYAERGSDANRDRSPRGSFGDRRPRPQQGGASRGGPRSSYGGRSPQRGYDQGQSAERRDRPAGPGGERRDRPTGPGGERRDRPTGPSARGGIRSGLGRSSNYDRRSEGFGREGGSGPSRGPSSGFNRSGGPQRSSGPGRSGPSRGPSSGFNRSGSGRGPSRGPGTTRPSSGPNRSRPNSPRPNSNTGPRRSGPPRRRDEDE